MRKSALAPVFILVLSLAFPFSLSAALPAEERPLAPEPLRRAVAEAVSGEIAFRYTVRISQFDRIQANAGWHDAAAWIRNELLRMGYADAIIEGWPSNGSTRYFTYKTPIGWKAESAWLWMVEPRRERLCDYEEVPLTLIAHSGPGHFEAELVDVGAGTEAASFQGKDVRGKFVLAYGRSPEVMREACWKRGALGVVSYYPPDVRPGYPNMIRYTAFWPLWEERDKMPVGFNVSKNQGAMLQRLLAEGKRVVLRAHVDSEFFETSVEALSASLPGTDAAAGEILILGHLCHPQPSANDNASGSGGMLEIARALKALVESETLPAPRRTIRFLWIPEFAGTVPYIKAHLEQTRKTLAALNCDMIGEDLHLTGGMFTITATPDSNPDVLTDVAVHFARMVDDLGLISLNGSTHPFAWRVEPFSGGSDHWIYNDGALKVPSVMFGHGDTFHHTSLDTPDKVDPTELRRVAALTLGIAYYLASAGEPEALDMARLVVRNGLGRLAAETGDALGALAAADAAGLPAAYKQALNVLERAAARERAAADSASRYAPAGSASAGEIRRLAGPLSALERALGEEAKRIYADRCRLFGLKAVFPAASDGEKAAAGIIPVRPREFVCPVESDFLVEKLGPEVMGRIRLSGNAAYEALNHVDGKRSVADIARAVSASYGPQNIEDVVEYFRVLAEAGLIVLGR